MKILVVGGGRGIGCEIVAKAAERGHSIGIIGRSNALPADSDRVPDAVSYERADVLNLPALRSAVEKLSATLGGIDSVVFSAGRFRSIGPLADTDPDEWRLDLETTLVGFAHVVRATVPSLRDSRSASLIALIGPGLAGELAGGSGYASAQAGLARLAETLAVEFVHDRIAVFALNPGLVPTGLMTHLLGDDQARRCLPRFTEAFAEGKEVGPEVAAEMAIWLIEERPEPLNGRIVSALLSPDYLKLRLDRIVAEDSGRLRLR